LKTALLEFWQARQESNPQPPLLESGALPIELLACAGSRAAAASVSVYYTTDEATARLRYYSLLGFPVQSMLAAVHAELVQFQTPRIIPAVFLGCVVAIFALRTSQSNHRANIFL
jgi:hypothetical protein